MCVLKMIMLRLPPEHPLGTYIHKNTFIHVLDITHASHRGGNLPPSRRGKKIRQKMSDIYLVYMQSVMFEPN